jgi:uncharacterized protein
VAAATATATVTVRGEAVIRAQPDEALLGITLSALHESPGDALADVEERHQTLSRLLDELGIRKADRSTSDLAVREELDQTAHGRRLLGHRASARVMVRVTDLTLAGQVMSRASRELRATVDGPRWSVTRNNPVRLQAATEAAIDARRKAQAYAAGVQAELGPLVKLSEPDPLRMGRRPTLASGNPSSGSDQISLDGGEHEVAAVIEATFVLGNSSRSSARSTIGQERPRRR